MSNFIRTLTRRIPKDLLPISGHVPYTGRAGFENPQAPLYFLGLNPGGDPYVEQAEDTIQRSLAVWRRESWSEYMDSSWGRQVPGGARMQIGMQHVFGGLGLDLRRIPASNWLFPRSREFSVFPYDKRDCEEQCWPFHRTVIEQLDIRTLLVAHSYAFDRATKRLGVARRMESVRRANHTLEAAETPEGIRLIKVPHPSRFSWLSPTYDPTKFIARHALL